MGNCSDRIYAQAEKRVLEIVADDAQWELFVQQVAQQDILDLNECKGIRHRVENNETERRFLTGLYISHSLTQICDTCDYNPNHRKGQKRFTARRRFDCTWLRTQGDTLAEQTAIKEGLAECLAVYHHEYPDWRARYAELSRRVLQAHTDRTTTPSWLDVAKNLCPHHYIDLTRP
jgi:hypothetical protein